jgi:hypothetical protein
VASINSIKMHCTGSVFSVKIISGDVYRTVLHADGLIKHRKGSTDRVGLLGIDADWPHQAVGIRVVRPGVAEI